jgi:hypothetical protein
VGGAETLTSVARNQIPKPVWKQLGEPAVHLAIFPRVMPPLLKVPGKLIM